MNARPPSSSRVELTPHRVRRLVLILVLSGLFLALARTLRDIATENAQPTAQSTQSAPDNAESSLAYLEDDLTALSAKIAHHPRRNLDQRATLAEVPNIPAMCGLSGLWAAPRGQWLAVQFNCEASAFVRVVHAQSGKVEEVGNDLGSDSLFLSWSPTGNEIIVKVDVVSNPRVYAVHVASGKAEQLPVPETTYDVVLTQNGKRMLYSLTQGLGFGSETWIADVDGKNAKRIMMEPNHIIAYARWSPNEKQLTYIRMPDSNIPFTVGELWMRDGAGENPVLLGEADAGHGYEPQWSPDGAQIAYVGRENKDNPAADQRAERLASNIYVATVSDKSLTNVTQFNESWTENPAWAPDGEYLAFNTNASGAMEVWVYDVKGKGLKQVSRGGHGRNPTWLPGGGKQIAAEPETPTPAPSDTETATLETSSTVEPSATETATVEVSSTVAISETETTTVEPAATDTPTPEIIVSETPVAVETETPVTGEVLPPSETPTP